MNQGSDAVDLIGGFKPIQIKFLIQKLLKKFVKLFTKIANLKSNENFLENLKILFLNNNYSFLLKSIMEALLLIKEKIEKKLSKDEKKFSKLLQKAKKIQSISENIFLNKDKVLYLLNFIFLLFYKKKRLNQI